MTRRLVKELSTVALTLLGLLLLAFALSRLSPIDPTLRLVGDHASLSAYADMRRSLGLDQPWPIQLQRYIVGLVHGDLGVSLSTGAKVGDDLRRVFPATLELATLAMALCLAVGLPLGLLAAWRPRGFLDAGIRLISLLGNSVPIYWLGLLALYVVYAKLGWVAGPGRLDDAFEYTLDLATGSVLWDSWRSAEPRAFTNAVSHLILPVTLLSAYALGNVVRLTRAALLNERHQEYVMLARAKGATEGRILVRHMLPNAAAVIVTVAGLAYANLLEGAVLIETVFARPGLGRYLTTALFAADAPAILGATLTIGVCFILINGTTDLIVKLLDPRLR